MLKKVKIFAVNDNDDNDCEIVRRERGESFEAFYARVVSELRTVLDSYEYQEKRT